MCVCVGGGTVEFAAYYGIHVAIRGQLKGVHSSLPPCESHGLNSGCQAWQQTPLTADCLTHPKHIFYRDVPDVIRPIKCQEKTA